MFYLIGLGNPEESYQNTRHNIGRQLVVDFCKKNNFSDFTFDKKSNALLSKGKILNTAVMAILPQGFMNNTGKSLTYYIKNLKQAEKIFVLHDDLDLPIGNYRIQFNRGSAGHRGIESINKYLKTQKYPRLKIGISNVSAKGKIKKPNSSEKVIKHVLGKFSPQEQEILKKNKNKIFEIIENTAQYGYLKAMNEFN
jgi:PTH1 family peptidyl-tRNA hydrolase